MLLWLWLWLWLWVQAQPAVMSQRSSSAGTQAFHELPQWGLFRWLYTRAQQHAKGNRRRMVASPKLIVKTPLPCLMPYVSHYWLSLDNQDAVYTALPDGAVDIVVKIQEASALTWVYGTTTRATRIALDQNCHYLGIRFMPGQSRHFLHAPAHALTDRCESANALLRFSFQGVLDGSADASVFTQINRLLQEHLSRVSPVRSRMDEAVAMMQQSHGVASIERAAEVFCRSRRQFERVFQEAVGVSPKLVAQISRLQHAAASAVHTASLADLAAKAGYADQSHMAHEFKRFANASPKRFVQENVAFLQGLHSPFAEN